jgi:excinuclease ABC subunit C
MTAAFDLNAFLQGLPTQPGVYRMYDRADQLIYVGKAKNLRNRVRSYFHKNPSQLSPKVQVTVQQVARMDVILTDSEVEALILESNLVKQHKPKYNILLRDDKKFPWIGISNEPFPRLFITRTPSKQGKTKFFGPYTNSADLYATLQQVRKNFPLRQRRKPLFQNRPCMNYAIGTCLGPCQNLVTPEAYANIVRQVELFLSGKADELLKLIEREMTEAAEALNFEWAAKLRDRYKAVESVVAKQKMVSDDVTLNQDIIALAEDGLRCMITVLTVRHGKLIGSRSQEIALLHGATPQEAYLSYLYQVYQDRPTEDLPDEILLQYPLEDEGILAAWLQQKRKKKVRFTVPQLGTKRDLLHLGIKNAREALEQSKRYDATRLQRDPARALIELQEALDLPDFPARMECYDISHVQGSHTVASMVVFVDGKPDKQSYRRFKIKTAEGKPDDFKSMEEVIRRRFAHSSDEAGWDEPDLVIIDGGKGQLYSAIKALQAHGIAEQPIISLAKKFEEVYIPGRERPILLPRDSQALFLLQQIRDEAHRFAITFHRSLRQKAATASALDEIPGIGSKRKQKLYDHYGTVEKIREASPEELGRVLGIRGNTLETIYQALHAPASHDTP